MAKRDIPAETIAKWRAAALRNQPWKRSTGPKTAEGKARASCNGKTRQRGAYSYRELFVIAKAIRREVRLAAAFRKTARRARPLEPGKASHRLAGTARPPSKATGTSAATAVPAAADDRR